MMYRVCLVAVLMLSLCGCRGYRSDKPAIHPNINMDYQPKFTKQTLPLPVPEGTVPYSYVSTAPDHGSRADIIQTDRGYYTGKVGNTYVKRVPIPVTEKTLKIGQERYDIYCAVCHSRTGDGNGMVVQRGYLKPPHLADKRLMAVTDGYLYDVVTHGVRNMPAYEKQIPVQDRWAIVTYVRALQRMNHGRLNDVPEAYQGQLK